VVGLLTTGVLLLAGCGDDSGESVSTAPSSESTESTLEGGNVSETIGSEAETTAKKWVDLMKAEGVVATLDAQGDQRAITYSATYQNPEGTGNLEVSINQRQPGEGLEVSNLDRVGITVMRPVQSGESSQGVSYEFIKFVDSSTESEESGGVWGLDVTPIPYVEGGTKSYGGLSGNALSPEFTTTIEYLNGMLDGLTAADFTSID